MRSFLHSPKSFLLLSLALPLLFSSAAQASAHLSPIHGVGGGLKKRGAESITLTDKREVLRDRYRDTFVGDDRTRGAGEADFEDADPLPTRREAETDPLGDNVNIWEDKV